MFEFLHYVVIKQYPAQLSSCAKITESQISSTSMQQLFGDLNYVLIWTGYQVLGNQESMAS